MAFEKKTARNMFIVGSVSLFGALIMLTVSFQNRLEERTQAATLLTESSIRGKELWETKNCVNCHSRMGEGAYYAPDLTKVITRKSEPWMRHFLKDPVVAYYGTEANAAGRRKMPNLNLSDEDIEDLIAFFRFIEGIDTNGWPKPETLRVRGAVLPTEGTVATGWQHFTELGCIQCHSINGIDAPSHQGPDITFAATRLTRDWMIDEILHPANDWAATAMPNYGDLVTTATAAAIVDMLEYVTLKNGGQLNHEVVKALSTNEEPSGETQTAQIEGGSELAR